MGSCALCALRRAALLVLKAEAGMCPRRGTFLSRQEKKAKEGDPAACDPGAQRRGNLWCSVLAGSRSNSRLRRSNNREP